MFQDTYANVANAAKGKLRLLDENPLGYIIASILAGIYISFGSFVAMTVGGFFKLESAAAGKLLPAVVFAAALSFVIMAGSELFTGNNLVMASASFSKEVSWLQTIRLWLVCYLGNLVGCWLVVFLYHLTGLDGAEEVKNQFLTVSAMKVGASPIALLSRGLLCNMLICIAIWCSIKMATETGKLLIVFWAIIVFFTCGFEHSIANMSILAVGMLNGGGDISISLGQYGYNLFFVTIGNMIGGVLCVALPYHLIAKK